MKMSESIGELAKALSNFQGEVESPKNKATNPFFKSKYAPLEEVIKAIKPSLQKHGLSVTQIPITDEGKVGVITILLHESGEYIETSPLFLKTDKDTAQGAGSAITYARRYALSAVLGIASEEDDDGNVAETKSKQDHNSPGGLSEGQIKRLYAIAYSKNIDAGTVKEHIYKRYRKKPEELTREEYDIACKGYEEMKQQ